MAALDCAAPPQTQATFTWVVPFSTPVWCIIFTSLLIVGIVMCYIERRYNEEDFGKYSHHRYGTALRRGMYLSISGFVTKTVEFEPKTPAGKARKPSACACVHVGCEGRSMRTRSRSVRLWAWPMPLLCSSTSPSTSRISRR